MEQILNLSSALGHEDPDRAKLRLLSHGVWDMQWYHQGWNGRVNLLRAMEVNMNEIRDRFPDGIAAIEWEMRQALLIHIESEEFRANRGMLDSVEVLRGGGRDDEIGG